MPDPTHDEFVRVYDTRTGAIQEHTVPAHWLGQPWAAHLKPVPSNGRFAKPNPDAANTLTDDPGKALAVDTSPAPTTTEAATTATTDHALEA